MKRLKKIVALILSMILFVLATIPVSASASQTYRIVYSAQEITDISAMRELAKGQSTFLTLSDEKNSFEFVQLLEVREYNDGTTQKTYVSNSYTNAYEESTSGSKDSYAVLFKFYYTVKADSLSLTTTYTFRPDKLVTTITKYGTPTLTISKLVHEYFVPLASITASQTHYYTNSSSVGSSQTFTMYSKHNGFYNASYSEFWSSQTSMLAQSTVYFSDGKYLSLQCLAYLHGSN